jgi:hypothetical protein
MYGWISCMHGWISCMHGWISCRGVAGVVNKLKRGGMVVEIVSYGVEGVGCS